MYIEEKKQGQIESAIDYRKCYINYISAQIEYLLKELREINNMSENLIKEKMIRERISYALMQERNREFLNERKGLKKLRE